VVLGTKNDLRLAMDFTMGLVMVLQVVSVVLHSYWVMSVVTIIVQGKPRFKYEGLQNQHCDVAPFLVGVHHYVYFYFSRFIFLLWPRKEEESEKIW
jgi:hypothetical protein